MPRATTNKSLRLDDARKDLRRRSVTEGETDEENRVAGASGTARHARRRPGRAASLRGTAQRTRSQSWRSPAKGSRSRRRGVLAKGARTNRTRTRR